MFDVITFGSATRDVFLRSKAMELHREHGLVEACFVFGAKLNVEELILETGGGGTNSAVTFSRMAKMRTAVVTRIGADSPGEDIIKALKKDRVVTEFVQHDNRGTTGYSSIILSGDAERTILTYRGVSSEIDGAKVPWSKLKAKLFHVSSLGGDLVLLDRIIVHTRRLGAKVYWNPGLNELSRGATALAPFLKRVDLVSLNRDEAAMLTNKKTADLRGIIKSIRRLAAHSLVTDGEKGAYAVSSENVIHAAPPRIVRTNITGAGDAFFSAFAVGFLIYRDPKTALALGTLNATNVVQHMGAKVGILNHLPHKRELAKIKIKKISF